MNQDEIFAEISRLPLSQKLLLTQNIWDDIARETDSLPLSEWQKKELDRRYELYKQGDMNSHSWEEVHTRLREGVK